MFRNSYDNDTVTYSPTGRIFQVEYALEAIKQGSAAVGLRSATHVVLVALKRNAEELGSYQKKLIRIDDNLGVALAGLAPDARILANHLRNLSMRERLLFDRPLAVGKASASIADKAHAKTQYGGRPYGVGLLVAGYDEAGPHLFEFLPSGTFLEYYGSAIGARSQAGRTYLERNIDKFNDSDLEQLIVHGLLALRDTLPQGKELTLQNTSVAIVGKDQEFKMIEDDAVAPWLDRLDSTARRPNPASTDTTAAQPDQPDQPDQTDQTDQPAESAPTDSVQDQESQPDAPSADQPATGDDQDQDPDQDQDEDRMDET